MTKHPGAISIGPRLAFSMTPMTASLVAGRPKRVCGLSRNERWLLSREGACPGRDEAYGGGRDAARCCRGVLLSRPFRPSGPSRRAAVLPCLSGRPSERSQVARVAPW